MFFVMPVIVYAAVTTGVNSGFVEVAPSANPVASSMTLDDKAIAVKDTSPATAGKITEIGWYNNDLNSNSPATNYEIGLYDHDGGGDKPDVRLQVITGLTSAAAEGWETTVVDWEISASTIYWIAVQMDSSSPDVQVDYTGADGLRALKNSQTALTAPWGTSSNQFGWTVAVYAVWDVAPPDTCTAPGSGDWNITCDDECVLADDQDVPENMILKGSGRIQLSAILSFTGSNQYIEITDGCSLEIISGGQIG